MKAIKDALDYILRRDEMLTTILGRDEYGFDKVYEAGFRPDTVQPPFVIYQILPGAEPSGTYSDNESIDGADFQVTAWGRNSQEVWQVESLMRDAIRSGDWNTLIIPLHRMRLKRMESPGEMPDRDTKWRQVPVRWRLDTSK